MVSLQAVEETSVYHHLKQICHKLDRKNNSDGNNSTGVGSVCLFLSLESALTYLSIDLSLSVCVCLDREVGDRRPGKWGGGGDVGGGSRGGERGGRGYVRLRV